MSVLDEQVLEVLRKAGVPLTTVTVARRRMQTHLSQWSPDTPIHGVAAVHVALQRLADQGKIQLNVTERGTRTWEMKN